MAKGKEIRAKCDQRNRNTKVITTRFVIGDQDLPADAGKPGGRGAKVVIQVTEMVGAEVLPEVVPGKEYVLTVS